MGKRSRKDDGTIVERSSGTSHAQNPIVVDSKAVDPTLALLFTSSAGPVKPPPKTRYEEPFSLPRRQNVVANAEEKPDEEDQDSEGEDDELSSVDEDLEDADDADFSEEEEDSEEAPELDKLIEAATKKPERKRKRNAENEDLEGKYMQRLAKEEEKEEEERQAERRLKRQRLLAEEDADKSKGTQPDDMEDEAMQNGTTDENSSEDEDTSVSRIVPSDVPLHESLAPSKDTVELEKASRTVFLANVSTDAITSKSSKKTLLAHMGSFLSSLPDPPEGKPHHKVESLRFRSTAYGGGGIPKKAAFAKKELMATTTKSTNAYVVYSSAYAAREAVKRLNGTVVLDRHLRVDGVAHPAKTDHRRCVFVGNLGFVDDESMLEQGGENERKRSKIPSDIEEGLWRQFGKAGAVESVRVVRDEKTRVGKGFAYVQFKDENAVEAALLFNEKKYPPMLPRILRVVRAKAIRKTALALQATRANFKNARNPNKQQIYNPKLTSEISSLQGRAGKLLGRAGAAKFRKSEGSGANGMAMGKRGREQNGAGKGGIEGIKRTPESIVFEGYRATSKAGRPKDLKLGGGRGGKKKGKPRTRSSKRGTEWKRSGARKAK